VLDERNVELSGELFEVVVLVAVVPLIVSDPKIEDEDDDDDDHVETAAFRLAAMPRRSRRDDATS